MNIKEGVNIMNSNDSIDVYLRDNKVLIEIINEKNKTVDVRYLDGGKTERVSVSMIMQDDYLVNEICNFIQSNNYGVLATNYDCYPLSSPVIYYANQKNEIYIPSVGGNKFKNLGNNNNVCLLVNTEYEDYNKIKGVQVFGKAEVYDKHSQDFKNVCRNIKDEEIILNDNTKIIKISPIKMIYLNSLGDGERRKYEVERRKYEID